jgi:methyl-accepting chemotaxis protein
MNMIKFIRDLPVGIKVAVAPAIAVMSLLVLGTVAWLANSELNQTIKDITEKTLVRQEKTLSLKNDAIELSALINKSLAWEGAGYKAEQIQKLDTEITKKTNALSESLRNQADDDLYSNEDREQFLLLLSEYKKFQKALNETLDLKSGGLGTTAGFMATMDTSFQKMVQIFTEIEDREVQQTRLVVDRASSVSRNNGIVIAMTLIAASLVCTVLGFLAVRLIVIPMRDATKLANRMAAGDFTVRIEHTSRDATGQVLEAMMRVASQVGNIVSSIRSGAHEVEVTSNEIAQGNADLSTRTESNASSLEETTAAVQGLLEQVQSTAENAKRVEQLAYQADHVADEGGIAVVEATSAMNNIYAQAKKISEIIGAIDSIAFQTNILALNAAVEAARAGEQGRGFAVVASEVRTLAQRSSNAAKEIRELIEASVRQAEIGSIKVQVAGDTMKRIVDSIKSVTHSMNEISISTANQAHGFSQVEAAIADMDRNTHQNSAMVEEASAAASALKNQASKLLETVNLLKTN